MSRRSSWVLAAALVFLADTAPAAPPDALPRDIHFRNKSGELESGVRCAVGPVSRAEKVRVEAALRAARGGGGGPKPPTPTPTPRPGFGRGPHGEIPIAFHVVYSDTKRGRVGDVEDWQIEAQIDVLNASLQGTPFQFYLAKVDRTNNSRWFSGCFSNTTEYEMKQALATDPAHTFNIYTCEPQQRILGYSWYPWNFPETDVRHGIVVLYASLPGGSASPYNEGDTVTHETGHYLGLYHTFEGGCQDPGDYVDDTPAEQTPDYYCSEGSDTCPSTGVDPVHNYMDYSDDACLVEFTLGQGSRMVTSVSAFRPSL